MRYLLYSIAFALSACGPQAHDNQTSAERPAAMNPAATTDTSHRKTSHWSVNTKGAGTVKIGMTFAELAPHLAATDDTARIGSGCAYVSIAGAPDSVGFMVESGRLARIDVRGGRTTTAEGASIGDTEHRILELYPNARRLPHKYTEGNYLVAIPDMGADSVYRYVFETDGSRVTRYRAGVSPQVEWVEGCS